MSELRKFLSYYKPYKLLLTADILSAVLVAALALALPICVRYITKDILESGADNITYSVLQTGILMVVLIIFQTAFTLFYDYKGHDMGAKIERDMRQELFTHLQKMPFSFFDSQKTGQLMSRLTNDILNLTELYHHLPENIAVYGTQFVGSLIILLCINWKLAAVTCILLPVMALYSFIFFSKLQRSYTLNRQHIADLNSRAEENLSGIKVVKSFANEDIEVSKFYSENAKFYKSRSDIYGKEAILDSVIGTFFTQLITILIVVTGGIWIAGGSLDLANLLVFIMYTAYLTAPVPKLAFMVQQYQEGLSGYRRFREIIDTEPEIKDSKNASELKSITGGVTFDKVTFRYNGDQEYILKNLTLDIRAGETVAVVGRSGVGKTTLCSLIPRFYEAAGGTISIDGQDIREVTLDSLRRQIGIVHQETFLFAGTVLDNILYGKPCATEKDAVEAAKKANAHDFIMKLPNAYHTDIGQRGVRLSGGQRQRISIARVFLKDPKILIFDEATSALDYESEKAVMSSLKILSEGRTAFIIAHRLSTVRNADRIVVLTDEGIAEQGTHEELYDLGGIYSELYNSQDLG